MLFKVSKFKFSPLISSLIFNSGVTDGPTYPSSGTWERIRGIVLVRIRGIVLVLIVNFLQSTLVEFELSAPIASFILTAGRR